jgi:hypothetical protein
MAWQHQIEEKINDADTWNDIIPCNRTSGHVKGSRQRAKRRHAGKGAGAWDFFTHRLEERGNLGMVALPGSGVSEGFL